MRMERWIKGKKIEEGKWKKKIIKNMGSEMGEIDSELKGLINKGEMRDLDWDLRNEGRESERMNLIEKKEEREVIEKLIESLERNVDKKIKFLREKVIKNDENEWNVMVDEDEGERIEGMIDLGDDVNKVMIEEVEIEWEY